jgi:predicted amidohydrolase
MSNTETQGAVIQQPPVLLDARATLDLAVRYLHEAADAGARLIVFPETYLPGVSGLDLATPARE